MSESISDPPCVLRHDMPQTSPHLINMLLLQLFSSENKHVLNAMHVPMKTSLQRERKEERKLSIILFVACGTENRDFMVARLWIDLFLVLSFTPIEVKASIWCGAALWLFSCQCWILCSYKVFVYGSWDMYTCVF